MAKKNRREQRKESKIQQPSPAAVQKRGIKPGGLLTTLLAIGVCIIPFLFSRRTMDPVLALRFAAISLFLFLFLGFAVFIMKKQISITRNPIILTVFLLAVAFEVWSIFGISFADNKQLVYWGLARHAINIILLFVVTYVANKEESYIIRICAVLSVAAIIHGFIGISQFYEVGFLDIPGNYYPYGLMSNRNLFGTGQVYLLPFAAYLLYKGSSFFRLVASIALVAIISSAIISQTRSSWLAGIGFIMSSFIVSLLFLKAYRKKVLLASGATIGVAILLVFFFISTDTEGNFKQSLKERTSNMFTEDTLGVTSTAAGNVTERLKIWKKSVDLIKDNMLTGVGLGNWRITVAKYGSEGLAWAQGKYVPDAPHNDYLLIVSETGVPGTIFYYGMWIFIIIAAIRTIFTSKDQDRRMLNILMASGLLAFAIDSFFSFPYERIEHCMYAYIMAGLILATFKPEENPRMLKIGKPVILLLLVITAFGFFLGLKKMSFEHHVIYAKGYEEQKKYDLSIAEGYKGKNPWVTIPPNGFPIESYIALSYKNLRKFPEALKEADASIKLHPYNKALYANKGTMYTDMGKYDSALIYYDKAIRLTPDFDIIKYNLAINYWYLKRYKDVVNILKGVDISPYPQLQHIKQQSEEILARENSGN